MPSRDVYVTALVAVRHAVNVQQRRAAHIIVHDNFNFLLNTIQKPECSILNISLQ